MEKIMKINTGDEELVFRTISTSPKEHFEGRWRSGRLYPLYSVVVNNGTTFISQNAKMKEEPYVIYDATTQEFKAPEGWIIKEMSADSRVTALGGGGGSVPGESAGFGDVTVEVDNTSGTPQATVTASGPDTAKNFHFAFSGLKGTNGTNGTNGQNGQPGQDGANGKSAYQIWLDEGNDGYESDFLDSLKGDDGATPAFAIGTVTTSAAGTQASASITGTAAIPVLNLNIPKGDQGNTGSSIDYPFELVNNRTTDDATKGLSAAEGKRLGDDLVRIEDRINQKFTGYIGFSESDSAVVPASLLPYTNQYGTVSISTTGPAYLWICMSDDGWGVDSCGIEIPMRFVGIISGYYCWVSLERFSGMVAFNPVRRHKVKSDTEQLVIAARSYTVSYGDDLPIFGYTANGEVEGTPAISCQATSESGVGEYEIVITRGTVTDDNAVYENGTLTIEKAQLTVTADNKYVELNGTIPTLTLQYEGFVNGEDASDLTTAPTCSTTAQSTATAGNYPIVPSGGVASNYEFVYVNGILTVGYVLQYTATQLENSGSCGGYLATSGQTDANKFKTSTSYTGIIIDISLYKGATIRFVRKLDRAFLRFAFLTASRVANNTTASYSSASGYTGCVQIDYQEGDTYTDVVIPADANYLYVYTKASGSYVGPDAIQFSGIVPPAMEMRDLPASMFSTNTTVSTDGTIYTGSQASTAICTGYLSANEYTYLGVLRLQGNVPPAGGTVYKINVAHYDPNKKFIRRDGAFEVADNLAETEPCVLPPSCGFVRIIVYQYNGATSMGGDTIRFDGDDLQAAGSVS